MGLRIDNGGLRHWCRSETRLWHARSRHRRGIWTTKYILCLFYLAFKLLLSTRRYVRGGHSQWAIVGVRDPCFSALFQHKLPRPGMYGPSVVKQSSPVYG